MPGPPTPPPAAGGRRAEIAGRLAAVRDRIGAACEAAGRNPGDVTLIGITKTFPASDVRLLYELGVTDVGENRDQEAAPKAAQCGDLSPGLSWHFVGQLQTNKSASVVSYASVVHSVDRVRLVRALGAGARRAGRVITCLVQASLDGDPDRGGALAADVPVIARALAAEEGLVLGGVMAMAPLGAEPAAAFTPLPGIAAVVREIRPEARIVSAGMSGDLEDAIAAGATHVRVGTALLGGRPPVR
ncbi:MAG TPA: YggS family pyridoxal phosphate-dependent enzyme [Streptosporangiaceae bacterium]|nr:YggS family pyridoxal phosphate-dependent enzyme [Streptosporangiaceae bacterium]